MAVDGTLGVVLLDSSRNGGHGLNRFHREIPNCGFVGEHHGVGAIKDGVGHVAHFSAGRPGAGGHGIQHLGGRDDGNAKAVGLANQFLLQQRYFLGRHLHPKVTAGHHHAVTQRKDRIDLIDGLKFFDLRHHRGLMALFTDQPANLLHVGGIPHEAEGHPVHPLAEAESQVGFVLVGKGANGKLDVREVDALVVRENSTDGDGAMQGLLRLIDGIDLHLDASVVEQDSASGGDFVGEFVVSHRCDRFVAAHRP